VAWCFGARYHQPKLSINRWLKAGSGFKQSQNAWILDMHTYIYMYIHIYIYDTVDVWLYYIYPVQICSILYAYNMGKFMYSCTCR
jgi:hypothetical protein